MTRFLRIFLAALCLTRTACLQADPGPLVLWSPTPAVTWQQEAYPIGNGKLAAMIFGGVANEQIQFNEDTIWTGQPHYYSNPNATPAHLASIRSNVFARNDGAIWSEASQYLMSVPLRQAQYQPAGVLNLNFAPHSGTANYRRTLDLNTATAGVQYDYNGVTYLREVFASAPSNRVIVIRLTANQTAKINFVATFSTLQPDNTISTSGNDLIMDAKVSVMPRPEYFATGLTNGIAYQARLRILNEGGTVSSTSGSLTVANADAVTLLLSVASNYKKFDDLSANHTLICSNNVVSAATNTYVQLRAAQLADYQALFHRVVLDLGTSSKTNFPTGYRIKRAYEGDDPQLHTLYFQMARYLMISGSRPGSQPLNLQGKWNDLTNPQWESKHTLNINQFLNYSGCEMANLSESHDGKDGIWPCGQAWLAQNLWWHYQYTGDTNFLANTAYPLMKGAAEFFLDFLVPHATNASWLITCPSYSSEHNWKSGSTEVANVPGPTMDNEFIRELCDYLIQSTHLLGIDAAFRTNLINLRAKLPPNKVGQYGQLQEWIEDVDSGNDTHRHCSHLVGLYPGETVSPFYTPVMAAAAKVSTDARCGNPNGDIGWGKAWRIGLQARLQNANFAYLYTTNMLTRDVSTNLMFTDVVNRQCDGIFGALGSVTEMLLQSQSGELHLLPALPPKWTNGLISGICARGGFTVDLQWQSNRLTSANILSRLGSTCRVRSRCPIGVKLGSNYIDATMILPGLYEFGTIAGSNYSVMPATVFETENLSATISAGDTHQILTNSAFSSYRGSQLNANANGDFVAYTLTNIPAGTYQLTVAADCGVNRARFQLACGPIGSLTNVGPIRDTYSATNVVYLLPTNALTTTLLWTNMLKEFNCGQWTAPTNGSYEFRFTVVDKNAASSGFDISFDYIKLNQAAVPAPLPPPKLSASANHGSIILSWPTNAFAYALEQTDELLSSNWISSSPGPVVWGEQLVVTNATSGEKLFYRLRKL